MGGNADWNPTHGALFTGAGTPWGGMQTGDPGDMPNAPGERDINSFSAYDQSEMVKRLISNLRGSGSKQTQGAMRSASRMGAGQSDAARAQVGNIAADVEDRSRGVELQAAKDAWQSKMDQKQFAEQMDLKRYQMAVEAWKQKKALRDEEEAKRKAGVMGMITGAASTLGEKAKEYVPGRN